MSATVGGGGTGVGTGGQEEDKKPMDQSAHINLKVKGQLEMEDGDEIDAMLHQTGGRNRLYQKLLLHRIPARSHCNSSLHSKDEECIVHQQMR
ncbi:small ubiquitin-related modifier 2 [Quercus suber]|uniref:Small ubiquitin-related modifier 2 n=1 Tax=Quercus suber TaxID=58331 RepID=A0AAW0LT24_QUESU